MKIVKGGIPLNELQEAARNIFGNMVKAVVDIERRIMSIGGELHSDEEALLLNNGSEQKNLWGINIYPFLARDEWIEFDSIINLRPSQGNVSRNVEKESIREEIAGIVYELVK